MNMFIKELQHAGIATAAALVAAAALTAVLTLLLGSLGLFIALGVWPLAFGLAWAVAFVALDRPNQERR
jgi:hypothetical protein